MKQKTQSKDCVFLKLVTAPVIAASTGIFIGIEAVLLGREELVDGETDPFKEIAGIVRCCGTNALLFGDAEVIGGYEKLNITLKLDYSEQAKGNINPALLIPTEYKTVVKYPPYAVGNITHIYHIIVGVFAAALIYV